MELINPSGDISELDRNRTLVKMLLGPIREGYDNLKKENDDLLAFLD